MDDTEKNELGQFVGCKSSQIYPGGPHGLLKALFINQANQRTELSFVQVAGRLKDAALSAIDHEELNAAANAFRP